MNDTRLISYILIGIGVVALISSSAGIFSWLWVALLSAAFLAAYLWSPKYYGLLVVGGLLSGVAVGLALGNFAAMLISLGAGFFVIDSIAPRQSHWPLYPAVILALFGLLVAIERAGILQSLWFPVLLIAIGGYLLFSEQEGWSKISSSTWIGNSAFASLLADISALINAEVRRSPMPSPATRPATPQRPNPVVSSPASAPADAATAETTSPSQSEQESTLSDDTPADSDVSSVDSQEDRIMQRYQRLLEWRKEVAEAEDKSETFVLRDSTLEAIAQQNPQDLEALADIKGIGPVKLESYGEDILALLLEVNTQH